MRVKTTTTMMLKETPSYRMPMQLWAPKLPKKPSTMRWEAMRLPSCGQDAASSHPMEDGHMPTFSGAQRAVARGTVIFRYYTTVLRGATTFETQEFLVGGGFIKIDPSKPADAQNLAIAWGEHEGKELHSPCISFTPSSADTSTREKKRKNAKAAN